MERWLAHQAELAQRAAALVPVPAWVATPTAEIIMDVLGYTHSASTICTITGGAGVGKTMTIAHYAATHPNVWILEATPATATTGGCLRALANRLKVPASGLTDGIEAAIRERLTGSGGLLIVDEAQYLHAGALESLRRLVDLTDVGLALAGNERIYTDLIKRTRAAYFAQLTSRISKRLHLTRSTAADADILGRAWGIAGREHKPLAREIAAQPGGLRTLTEVLRVARTLAPEGITADDLRAAWGDML